MDPRFVQYYQRELHHIREMGSEFSQQFPKIAGRLGLDGFDCADPYVERLLEGFAFLTARLQLKLDAEFPRFTQQLLEMVYPLYLTPIPSMAIVQFQPDLTEGALAAGYVIPRDTSLRSVLGKNDQTACEYRTAHATTLWPVEITQANYFSRNVASIALPPGLQDARAAIRLKLRATAGLKFNELALDSLPCFIRGGNERSMFLYEQLFAHASAVLIRPVNSAWHQILDSRHIRPLGFAPDEALLPCVSRSFDGYRLLQEYFACHQRFLNFELTGLGPAVSRCEQNELEIVIVLNRVQPKLENVVSESDFALYCTPAVNLFPHRSDRILLNPGDTEYHVVPDRTRPMDLEVFQIESVVGFDATADKAQEFRPFYAARDTTASETPSAFFTVARRQRVMSSKQQRTGARSSYVGSEVFLSIVDADEAPFRHGLEQLGVRTLCSNRDLPLFMPVGRGSTDFNLEIGAPVESTRCLAGPTEPRPSFVYANGDNAWRLVSHLSLNYLSLVDNDNHQGASALRDLLKLYVRANDVALQKQVEGLRSVASQTITRRFPGAGPITYARGLEIAMTCDETAFEGAGVYLLGAVLAQFFTKYVSLNSFTETVLKSTDRGEIKRWPAMPGKRHLI